MLTLPNSDEIARGKREITPTRGRANGLDDFQALVTGYRDAIFRLACRLTGNRDRAEDLVQESLIEAFQAFDHFRIGTHFDRWVYQIMTRTFIDKFKRRKGVNAISFEDVAQGEDSPHLADSRNSPHEMLDRVSWSAQLQEALGRLSPEFRAAVILCDAQGLSYEEASQVLGCPVGTVRSRLHRARDQLRARLTQRLGPEEG